MLELEFMKIMLIDQFVVRISCFWGLGISKRVAQFSQRKILFILQHGFTAPLKQCSLQTYLPLLWLFCCGAPTFSARLLSAFHKSNQFDRNNQCYRCFMRVIFQMHIHIFDIFLILFAPSLLLSFRLSRHAFVLPDTFMTRTHQMCTECDTKREKEKARNFPQKFNIVCRRFIVMPSSVEALMASLGKSEIAKHSEYCARCLQCRHNIQCSVVFCHFAQWNVVSHKLLFFVSLSLSFLRKMFVL